MSDSEEIQPLTPTNVVPIRWARWIRLRRLMEQDLIKLTGITPDHLRKEMQELIDDK